MASTAAIPVFTVLAVFSQEVSRYGSYRLMKLAQPSFEYLKESEKSSVNDIKGIAVSVGGGFAFAAGCFSILNVMFLSLGPGIPGIDGKTPGNPMLVRSLLTCAVALLNYFWTLILFHTCEERTSGTKWFLYIIGSHLLNSLISLANYKPELTPISIMASILLVITT